MPTKSGPIIVGRHIDHLMSGSRPYFPNISGGRRHILPSKLTGTDVLVQVDQESCYDSVLEFAGGRHIRYGPGQIPHPASPVNPCCDAFISGAYDFDCWPLFGGITRNVRLYTTSVANCFSANNKKIELFWDGFSGWQGGPLDLAGGSLTFRFSCNSGPVSGYNDPGKFRLEWFGCHSGSVNGGISCAEPLTVNFGNTIDNAEACCDCFNTADPATINVVVYANCNPIVRGRHIDYTPGVIPIVAIENPCNTGEPIVGCNMTCGLTLTITNVTGCACMADTDNLVYIGSNVWEALSVGSCAPTIATLSCETNLDDQGVPDGTLTLTFTIQCGVATGGTAEVIINQEDLEDLDISFPMGIDDPFYPLDCLTCTCTWNAMTGTWMPGVCANPDANCACDEVTCAGPSGTFDGETKVVNCTNNGPPLECCEGIINVRIMR